ncbi:TlyA family RNA methyltransferase [Phosphitispora sp. TUW77]|uniref:TlyA family RNA methyltransferase n=1 Tax=Phosphitispora sp. TUW77 TaxID=3152361 RepID=UPI003AB815CE
MSGKKRLDVLLVENGFYPSREKAKASIMAGLITVNGQRIDKAGTEIPIGAVIEVAGPVIPYVSRGGLKLEKAISYFGISFKGKTAVDIGASTGGFTDCALQHGAVKVYAIDVGYGQLDWKLRQDCRVINFERTNIRYFDISLLDYLPDIAMADVAFISLELVLPKINEMLQTGGEAIVLIKPQFEAGRDKVGKKGVVRNLDVHKEVIIKVLNKAVDFGFRINDITYSPIKGPEGNIEYLAYLSKIGDPVHQVSADLTILAAKVVGEAHAVLSI